MSIHYNAFISYRHHPDDIKVATDIHRSLERFHVPKALRKRTGKIERLFRDKDELPITSSLTDSITTALENSDFLIVICSEHTKESIWVQREIETFLKTHHRSRVLTVLASGEPQDTIPQILQEERTVDPVTGEEHLLPVEPLSCDWRMPRKRAVREELPRLAAALLGCGYDELRQRQRQYRQRRLVATFSAALAASMGLSAYFIYNSIVIAQANEQIRQANIQIQANLDQALENQSQYLSSASAELLDEGDRLSAIALAVAALPGQDNDRPYVAEAEWALSNALRIYRPVSEVVSVGAFTVDALVSDFIVTDDGEKIYILDRLNQLTVWNTETFQKEATVALEYGTNYDMHVTVLGDLILTNYNRTVCYDNTGKLLWEYGDISDIAYLEDGTVLGLVGRLFEDSEILFLDPKTGEKTRESILLQEDSSGASPDEFYRDTYADGEILTVEYYNWGATSAYLVDVQQQTQTLLYACERDILNVCQGPSGTWIVMASDGSGSMNGNYGNIYISSPARAEILCFDRDGQVVWTNEIISSMYSPIRTLERIPDTHTLLCQQGNTFLQLDIRNGKVLGQCQAVGAPKTLEVDEIRVKGVLDNGYFFHYDYEDNMVSAAPYMPVTLTQVQMMDGFYVTTENSLSVTTYRNFSDDSWEAFNGTNPQYLSSSLRWGDLLLVTSSKELYLYDVSTGQQLWTAQTEFMADILGFSEDGSEIYLCQGLSTLIRVDASTGEITYQEFPTEVDGDYSYSVSEAYVYNDRLHYTLEIGQQQYLMAWEVKTGAVEAVALDVYDENDLPDTCEPLTANGSYIWLLSDSGKLVELSLADGNCKTLFTDLTEAPAWLFLEDGTLLICAGSKVSHVIPGGEVREGVDLGERTAASMYVHGQQLVILCDDASVQRFDAEGTFLGKTYISLYNNFYSTVKNAGSTQVVTWQPTQDGLLILNAAGMGNVIDCGSWTCRANIPEFVTYHTETDRLVLCTDMGMGAYRRYTTQQLLDKAAQQLGQFRLTEDQLADYGLA